VSLINEIPKRTFNAAPKADTSRPVTSIYRIESKSDSSGTKGSFLATILIAGVVLVAVIVLGSRIAQHFQNVQDGFATDTSTPTGDTKPNQPAPTPELLPTLK
jgi:hypothetical protein